MRHRIAELRDLVQKRDAFLKCQLIRMRRRQGLGAAMAAGEGAGLGHLPIDVHWSLGEVPGGVFHSYRVQDRDVAGTPNLGPTYSIVQGKASVQTGGNWC